MTDAPMVSCIMPTYNRRPFAGKAIEYFLRQDYSNKQLVIVDDGTDSIADLVPGGRQELAYFRLTRKTPLGEKRNIAVENASADIILHWDDDDWYAAQRIGYQAGALIEENANICGLGNGFFYDICEDKFWHCSENLHNTIFAAQVVGGSLCYTRSLWHRLGKFHPHCALAEDASFLRKVHGNGQQILKLSNRNTLVYIRHGSNTWRFKCGQFFKSSDWICSVAFRDAIPKDDLEFYRQLSHTVRCS